MKNEFIKKHLCITLAAALMTVSPAAILAEDETMIPKNVVSTPAPEVTATPQPTIPAEPVPTEPAAPSEPTVIPTPDPVDPVVTPTPDPGDSTVTPTPDPGAPTVTPTPDPGAPTVTPTPDPGDPTVTPTPEPGDPTVTPTPDPADPMVTPTPSVTPEPTVTPAPGPVNQEKVDQVIAMIAALGNKTITKEDQTAIAAARKAYNELTAEEKKLVTNYTTLVSVEKKLNALPDKDSGQPEKDPAKSDENSEATATPEAQTGTPVYYGNYVSNLHAGKDFYLNSLESNYGLSFSEDFASVMDEIESEYRAKNGLGQNKSVTSSTDDFLVRNWQDILAVYVYEESKKGVQTFLLDGACKDDLADIFAKMNPVVRDEQDQSKVAYANHHIDYYIKANNLTEEEQALIKKYVETDCKLLCATVTAAKGFVRESVGDDVSEERVNVIAAAYSLVGKVGYFWGGKSTALGTDSSWGSAATVTAEGSKSTGTLRAFGLDCSGFVTWSVINGYMDQDMQEIIGDGTSDQWTLANTVSESDAQPGDLVFQRGPEAGSDNHVGIICGQTDSGDWIAVHCSSSQNGVTVGEAYSASFRYIRQPDFYLSKADFLEIENNKYKVDEYYGLEEESQANEEEAAADLTISEEETEIIAAPIEIAGEDGLDNTGDMTSQDDSSDNTMSGDVEYVGDEEIPVTPIVGVGTDTESENSTQEEADSILVDDDEFLDDGNLEMSSIGTEAYEEVPEEDIESTDGEMEFVIDDYDEIDPVAAEEPAQAKMTGAEKDALEEEEYEIDPVTGKKILKKKKKKASGTDKESEQADTAFDESIFVDVDIIDPEDLDSIRGVATQ